MGQAKPGQAIPMLHDNGGDVALRNIVQEALQSGPACIEATAYIGDFDAPVFLGIGCAQALLLP